MTRIFQLLVAVLLLSAVLDSQDSAKPSLPPQDGQSGTPVFHAGTSLVLVDVIAQDPKTGLPLNSLRKEDFRLLDDKKEVSITTFDSGAHFNTRPIALWFVVLCNEKNNGPHGEEASGSFLGKEALFRLALNGLDTKDRVGVAHWCDNGDARLDLPPTDNRDGAISALTEVLKPFDYDTPPASERRLGELTLQRLLRLIIEDAHQRNPQPLPVLLCLHSDYTGIPQPEFAKIVDDLLETSGIVFGIKDADIHDFLAVPPGASKTGEVLSALHYLAAATGGQYFSVHPKLYSTALESVLLQLHFRYELGFKPEVIDGKRHKLKVEFAEETKRQHKAVLLRYRPEYIPTAK